MPSCNSSSIALTLASVFAVSTHVIAGGNLLINGDAESGDMSPWILQPVSAPIIATGLVTQTLDPVQPFEGEFLFAFTDDPQSGTISMIQSGTIGSISGALRLSGRYQTEFEDIGQAVLRCRAVSGAVLSECATGSLRDADEQWREFSLAAPVPLEAASWEVELRGTLVTGTFINVFYDALQLSETLAADLDGDGDVDGFDLATLLGGWGPCPGCCPADLNGDGVINGFDLAMLLGEWS